MHTLGSLDAVVTNMNICGKEETWRENIFVIEVRRLTNIREKHGCMLPPFRSDLYHIFRVDDALNFWCIGTDFVVLHVTTNYKVAIRFTSDFSMSAGMTTKISCLSR